MDSTVGYLTKRFPRLSETFILDEILGLEASKVPLRLYSIMDPHESVLQPDVDRVRNRVTYLRRGNDLRSVRADLWDIARAHLSLLTRRTRRYIHTVVYIARRRRHWSTLRLFLEAGYLASIAEQDNARHLHAAFAHGPASIAHFVHLLTGVPFSFSAHAKDLYVSPPDLLARKIRDAEFVLVCSKSAARQMRQIAGPAADKVHLAYHGVDTERFRPAPPDERCGHDLTRSLAQPCVLAVGRLVEKKGYHVLLQALARVVASGRQFRCQIIGTGPLRSVLEAQASELGIEGVVSFLGARTHQEVASAYRGVDIIVQASVVLSNGDRDGVPNSLTEGMASGLAVVASSVAGIPEVVLDGVTGLLVPPGDVAALAAALDKVIDDPGLRRSLGKAARMQMVEKFDRRAAIRAIASYFPQDEPVSRTGVR